MSLPNRILYASDLNCGIARIPQKTNVSYLKLSNQKLFHAQEGEPFYESAAAVEIGDQYTHIDTNFRQLYDRPLVWTTRFYNDITLAAFSEEMHYHVINRDGRTQFNGMTFKQMWPFTRNYISLLRTLDDAYYFLLASAKSLCTPAEMLRVLTASTEGLETFYTYLLAKHQDIDYAQEVLHKPDEHALQLYDFFYQK